MQNVIITIPRDSKKPLRFETTGFVGESCLQTVNIEELLGNVQSRDNTSEMYDNDTETTCNN